MKNDKRQLNRRKFLLSAGIGTVAASLPSESILAPSITNVQDNPQVQDLAQDMASVLGDVKNLIEQFLSTSSATRTRILTNFQQLWAALSPEDRACLLITLVLRVQKGFEAPSPAQGGSPPSSPPSVGFGSIKLASPILTPLMLDEGPGTAYGVQLTAGNTSVTVGAFVDPTNAEVQGGAISVEVRF